MDFFTKKISLQQRLIQHELQLYPLVGSCLELRDDDKHRYPTTPLDLTTSRNCQTTGHINYSLSGNSNLDVRIIQNNNLNCLEVQNQNLINSKIKQVTIPTVSSEPGRPANETEDSIPDTRVNVVVDLTVNEQTDGIFQKSDKLANTEIIKACVNNNHVIDLSCHKEKDAGHTSWINNEENRNSTEGMCAENVLTDIRSTNRDMYMCSSDQNIENTHEQFTYTLLDDSEDSMCASPDNSSPIVNVSASIIDDSNTNGVQLSSINESYDSNFSINKINEFVTLSNNEIEPKHNEPLNSTFSKENIEKVTSENFQTSEKRHSTHGSCRGTCQGHDVDPSVLCTYNNRHSNDSATPTKTNHLRNKPQKVNGEPYRTHAHSVSKLHRNCSSCRACNRIMAKLSNINSKGSERIILKDPLHFP